MRIRKHAKISPLFLHYSGGSPLNHPPPDTHICLLNQSPWDLIPFPPSLSPSQDCAADHSFTGNGSLGDSIGAVESVASMKISFSVSHDNEAEAPTWASSSDRAKEEEEEGENHETSISRPEPDKSSTMPETTRRRHRSKKTSAVTDPHEFYYYSGFGPFWGKKRGSVRAEPSRKTEFAAAEAGEPSPSGSQINEDDEFTYVIDCKEDDDDDEEEEAGKKRGRKPIKARSLKSLM